jgi:hypothetical protein
MGRPKMGRPVKPVVKSVETAKARNTVMSVAAAGALQRTMQNFTAAVSRHGFLRPMRTAVRLTGRSDCTGNPAKLARQSLPVCIRRKIWVIYQNLM